MPRPVTLTFDVLTVKLLSESRVTWATSVPILVFIGLSVLDLGPMYATGRQTSDARHRLMPPALGAGHNKSYYNVGLSDWFGDFTREAVVIAVNFRNRSNVQVRSVETAPSRQTVRDILYCR